MKRPRQMVPSISPVLGFWGIFIVLFLLMVLPMPWNDALENAGVDVLFNIRGGRSVSRDIIYIYLSDEDVRAMGGWPITRDYYGYMIHVLTQRGARIIGLYALFDRPDRHYPEFDRRLADFFESSGKVCLPTAFAALVDGKSDSRKSPQRPADMFVGENALLPIPSFKDHAAGIGFSNLDRESVVRKMPVVVTAGDSSMLCFGAEMARLYMGFDARARITPKNLVFENRAGRDTVIPLDKNGRMRLNHFGDTDRILSMGFLHILHTFEASLDSLDLKGKLVIVDAASPSVPIIKATPLTDGLPAALIHATVAENVVFRHILRGTPRWLQGLILLVLISLAWLLWRRGRIRVISSISLGGLFVYLSVTVLLFSLFHIILPMIYPILGFILTMAYGGFVKSRHIRTQDRVESRLLEARIAQKHDQLEEAQTRLVELESRLASELEEKNALSEKSRQLAEEKQAVLLTLEKQIRDLEAYRIPKKDISKAQYREIVHAPVSKMVSILELVDKIGSDDITVLIQGETGTGKELIARAIHRTSHRKNAPFVAINCGALPETLLESELFGHEKGSFTGAHSRRRGRFELADGGILFLDEITETAPAFQARLLRVLQDGTFERLGGERTLKANVRIIAATNKDLKSEVVKGSFREDLFYRLQGFTLTIPPLRERPEDIPVLARHFLRKHGFEDISTISDRTHELMRDYRWPGNVRELENVVRRAAILAQSEGREMIQQADLPLEIRESRPSSLPHTMYHPLEEQILTMLRAFRFSRSAISQTARVLDNRDRGTITEHLRGFCFEYLVKHEYDMHQAARDIAGSDDEDIIQKVETKMKGYLHNLRPFLKPGGTQPSSSPSSLSCYRGLPKKYHHYLDDVLRHYTEIH